jgi:NADH:ubiquinone oxidoreductase subunit F (NADH-binding)
MTGPQGEGRLLRGIRRWEPLTLAEHEAVHGPLPAFGKQSAAELLGAIERSGLRGRGGAHVSTAVKLGAVAGKRRPILVANGAESEPASQKDAVLLAHSPHLVIDGVVAAARSVGANEAILYVKNARRTAFEATAGALRERGRSDPVRVRLVQAPASYVAGQETAAIAHLNGRRALPTTVPPRPFERGVDGRPTVVCNVETFAHIALIARYGPQWFREVGSSAQPGTALVTLSGAVAGPGVYETAFHTPLADLIARAGGLAGPVQALLVGGYGGRWLTAREMARLSLSEGDPLLTAGSIGAGVLVVLGSGHCGLREAARVLSYLAQETAAQCGPCLYGLRSIADGFSQLLDGKRRPGLDARLLKWARDVTGRGACRHPDGAARFMESALRVFESEIAAHRSGRCSGHGSPAVLPIPSARDLAA